MESNQETQNKEKFKLFNDSVKTTLIGKPKDNGNEFWNSIDSTNTRLASLANKGAAEGTTVISRQQSLGRGRLGREWVSSYDCGLYFSTLLRPTIPISDLPVITLCLGVSAKRAVLATSGVEIGLKWVNDLIYNTKKLGGILVEMPTGLNSDKNSQALVVGIGINVKEPESELPEEIRNKAVYLNELCDTKIDTISLASELCFQIEHIYNRMLAGESNLILDEWRASSVTLGQEIITSNNEISGKALDIDETGALIVQTAEGKKLVHAGEISVRSKDGSYSF